MHTKELYLPRLISDGMVLQCDRETHIWGWSAPKKEIVIYLTDGNEVEISEKLICFAGEDGRWDCTLQSMPACTKVSMKITDGITEREVKDILFGNVWFCSGQSNMDLMMDRVKDRYPGEITECENDEIRTFVIEPNPVYEGPLEELKSGSWVKANRDTIYSFSATAYFFGKFMYEATKAPVGLIQASLGGSRIQCWMSREMLNGYDELLKIHTIITNFEFKRF